MPKRIKNNKNINQKNRGLASASDETRTKVARAGGKVSRKNQKS